MDEALREARERKTLLYARRREALAAAREVRDPAERRRQQQRAKVLGEMYQEACEEVRRLDPSAPQRKPPAKRQGTGGAALDVLLQSGALWADLDGYTWSQFAGHTWGGRKVETGRAAQALGRMVREGLERCTPRQQEILTAYYASDDTLEEIGRRLAVGKSSVSRCIRRGLGHVSQYVTAKLLLPRCIDRDGHFDYLTFVNSAQLLTERQREMLFLALSRDTSYRDIARYVDRTPSGVWRSVARMEQRLQGIGVDLDVGLSAVKVRRQDWEHITEKDLAQRLGLSPRFYFGIVRRGETVGGIPLLRYVALRRAEQLGDPGAAAVELGCSGQWVRKLLRLYQGVELPDVPVEDYRPVKPRRVKLPADPYAAMGGDAIIDRIDAETYRKLRARFGTA